MLGVYQGRLTDSGQKLQCFPKNPFQEFVIAAKLKYNFIEFFLETNINKKNPIWSNIGIKNYIKSANLNNIKTYSLCDNFYIKNSLGDKKSLLYALKVLKRAKLLKIKKYIIPMYGKSFLTKKDGKFIHYTDQLKQRFSLLSRRMDVLNNNGYKIIDNTPEEILFGVIEMTQLINSKNKLVLNDKQKFWHYYNKFFVNENIDKIKIVDKFYSENIKLFEKKI